MRRILSSILILVIILSMCACTSSSIDYDGELIKTANIMLEEWGLEEGRKFSVTLDDDDIYHIDINGEELMVKIEGKFNKHIQKSNTKEYNSKVIDSSRNKVIDYINNSQILKDKEELVNYIKNIPCKIADFSEGEAAAEYDYKEDTVFINNKHKEDICEWMIVHELVHALSQKTNGGIENERYPYNVFNEALTDTITSSMNPKLVQDGISLYSKYYEWIYLYLGCVGLDGIEAYFYGYDKILEKIPEEELDIFVESIEQVDSQEDAIVIICNCINTWGLEKG